MATVSAPLNAEPALPDERAREHLPPKSYVNAVEEDAPAEGAIGFNGTNRSNGTTANGSSNVGSDHVKKGHQASVLNIVNTGAPPAEEKKEETKEDRPPYERQESKHEYSATVCSI
jgi:2-acylglycerol O-acyltransferase 2